MSEKSENDIKILCVIPAAGNSSRFKKGNKLFQNLNKRFNVLEATINNIVNVDTIDQVFIGYNANEFKKSDYQNSIDNILINKEATKKYKKIELYEGGNSRQNTVFNGLNYFKKSNNKDINDVWVIVHDAARPILGFNEISKFISNTIKLNKSCIMAIPVSETIKKVNKKNEIIKTKSRSEAWLAQTPQMFKFDVLFDSLKYCIDNNISVTDESQALETLGLECEVQQGKPYNIKITTDIDLIHAKPMARIYTFQEEKENLDD